MVDEITQLPGVSSRPVGETIEGETLKMLEIGTGEKTALIIGVPHSDEPMGSLVATYFARWLATHPGSTFHDWRWLIIPILERQGMRLNEGWFNNHRSFAAMARTYFRNPTEDQYEWNFPIRYKDYTWSKSRPETLAVKKSSSPKGPSSYAVFTTAASTTRIITSADHSPVSIRP